MSPRNHLSPVVALLLALAFVGSPAATDYGSAAPSFNSTLTPLVAAGESVKPCRNCGQWLLLDEDRQSECLDPEVEGCSLYHELDSDNCGTWNCTSCTEDEEGGSGSFATTTSVQRGAGLRKVARTVVGEDFGTCVRCGGTSTCHTSLWTGACHVSCSEVSGASMSKLREAIRIADAGLVREILTSEIRLEFNAVRASIQVLNCDGTGVQENIALKPSLAAAVDAALSAPQQRYSDNLVLTLLVSN
jgi:hypothetical protein